MNYERDFSAVINDFETLVGDKGRLRMLRCKRRDRHLVDKRQHFAKILRAMGYSYPEIAHAMNRDHTSIIHLCKIRREKWTRK